MKDIIMRSPYYYTDYWPWFVLFCNGQYFKIKWNSEKAESLATQQYAREKGFTVYPIFNEVSMWKAFRLYASRTADGLHKGIADLFFISPIKNNKRTCFFIEMKKRQGSRGWGNWSKIQPEQAFFHEIMQDTQTPSYIARGFEEAKNILDSYL